MSMNQSKISSSISILCAFSRTGLVDTGCLRDLIRIGEMGLIYSDNAATVTVQVACRASIERPATDDHHSSYIRHQLIHKVVVMMDGRVMLRSVAISIYLALIVSVTCSKNNDVMKQVRRRHYRVNF